MGSDGVAVSSMFKVNPVESTAALAPKVAYSPDMQKYLVLWYDESASGSNGFGGTIFGRFVSTTGVLEDVVSVVQDPSTSTRFLHNSILGYDSVNKQFVFVWEGKSASGASNDIYLRAIDTKKVFGNIVKVTESPENEFTPSMAVKSDGSEYCVAYTKNEGGVAVKRVDAVLGISGAETLVTSAGATDAGIVYNSSDNKYLVTWTESGTIKGKFINSCAGTDGGAINTIKNSSGKSVATYNKTSNTYAIIAENMTNIANGYVILSSQGTILRSGDVFGLGASNGNYSPVIAPNLTDGRFGATSAKDHGTTRFISDL
jgi:hypothetical protein